MMRLYIRGKSGFVLSIQFVIVSMSVKKKDDHSLNKIHSEPMNCLFLGFNS